MKSKYEEMSSVPGFLEFIERIKKTANYCAARAGKDNGIALCMAYSFEAGRQSLERENAELKKVLKEALIFADTNSIGSELWFAERDAVIILIEDALNKGVKE